MNERTYNSAIARLRSPERTERLEAPRVAGLCLENNNIKSMLDIGTGSGLFAEEFSKRNLKVAGVDINPEMLEAAKEFVPDGEFKLAPAENIPFADKEFDMAFMGVVFHEVDDFKKSLSEAARVADKLVAILEWDYKVQDFGPPLEHRLTKEFIENLAKETGFSKVEVVPLNHLVLYKLIF